MDEFFFFNTLKTYITAFGNVFNNVKVVHGNGNERTVPIRYASKEKFVEYLTDQAGSAPPFYEQAVPVIAYEMTEITYDPSRKINALKETFFNDGNVNKRILAPVPFNLTFSLSIFTRYGVEMLQIVEQILPYFQPSFNITIKEVPELGIIERDVPIILTGVNTENIYVGSKDERRHIEWTLTFEVRAWLYPNGNTNGTGNYPLINRVIIDFATNQEAVSLSGIDFMTDPFFITEDVPHIVRNANTYSEIFSGELGIPSINLPTIPTAISGTIIGGILTITEDDKTALLQSYNSYVTDAFDQYCEVEVRFDAGVTGNITLYTHAIDLTGYMAIINTLDGSVIFRADNGVDNYEIASLPAGTVSSTDEVRLEAKQITTLDDSILFYINNNKLYEGAVSTNNTQISKQVAVSINAEPTTPETAIGIKWLRAGSYISPTYILPEPNSV